MNEKTIRKIYEIRSFAKKRIARSQTQLEEIGWTSYTPFSNDSTWSIFDKQVKILKCSKKEPRVFKNKLDEIITIKHAFIARQAYRTACTILKNAETHMDEVETFLKNFGLGSACVRILWPYLRKLLRKLLKFALH